MRARPVMVRMLALAYAVGLAGLLVGLSVAPSTLPADTFHVTPKAAVGAAVAVDHVADLDLKLGGPAPTNLVDLIAIALAVALCLVIAWFATDFRPPATLAARPQSGLGGRAPPRSW